MRALILGVSGQDGAYLAELLLRKGYEVTGTSRDAQLEPFADLERLGHPRPGAAAVRGAHRLPQRAQALVAGRAGRGLQPRRAELGGALLRAAGRDDGEHRHRDAQPARGDPLHEAAASASTTPARANASATPAARPPTRRRPSGRAAPTRWPRPRPILAGRQLPRGLRPLRLLRHPLQPRVAAAPGALRDPEDRVRRLPHRAAAAAEQAASSATSRSATGAGPRSTSRRCGGCCSTTAGRLRHRHRGDAHPGGVRRRGLRAVGLDWREHVVPDPALMRPTDIEGNYADPGKAERVLG